MGSKFMFMLSGVGPKRAMQDRVSHVLHLFKVDEDTMVTLPFPPDVAQLLSSHGVPHRAEEVTLPHCRPFLHVSVYVPYLPRNYDEFVQTRKGVGWPIEANEEADAFREVVARLGQWQTRPFAE